MEDMSSDGTWRRRDMKTLKQQLPYPYNQDLSKILRSLNRRTPFARRRLANDPVTAAYPGRCRPADPASPRSGR